MAGITTSKEKALTRIKGKIEQGNAISDKLTSNTSLDKYLEILDEAEAWEISLANTVRQTFTDEHLAESFKAEGIDIVAPDESLDQKISNLKGEIKSGKLKLEHILNDLEGDVYTHQSDFQTTVAKWGFWQTIIVAAITAIGGIITGYIATSHKTTPLEKQGLSNLTLEGKWKYICTSFDGSYQHGGRFIVQKQQDGSLILNGERMWKDIKDPVTGAWKNRTFEESDFLLWHTSWILVRGETEINFEYVIPEQNQEVLGYCSGVINSENGKVVSVKGNFYVLNETPILTGRIIFKRVSDADFSSTITLPKNH